MALPIGDPLPGDAAALDSIVPLRLALEVGLVLPTMLVRKLIDDNMRAEEDTEVIFRLCHGFRSWFVVSIEATTEKVQRSAHEILLMRIFLPLCVAGPCQETLCV